MVQLGNPITASDEDAEKCYRNASDEKLELGRPKQLFALVRQLTKVHSALIDIIQHQNQKHQKREDLENQASDHNVDAIIEKLLVLGHRRDRSAGSLQEHRDRVAGHEDVNVPGRPEAREMLTED